MVVAYFLLVGGVALQRLLELRLSRSNEQRLKARGGREHAPEQMKWMTTLHCAWLLAIPFEVVLGDRRFEPILGYTALAVFACGQALRYMAIRTLKDRWCVRIITVPGEASTTTGIYSWLRHPNYLGVVLELAALPLVHSAWLVALSASVLNGLLLRARIRAEEYALARDEPAPELAVARPN